MMGREWSWRLAFVLYVKTTAVPLTRWVGRSSKYDGKRGASGGVVGRLGRISRVALCSVPDLRLVIRFGNVVI